jgi:hypothetical protein
MFEFTNINNINILKLCLNNRCKQKKKKPLASWADDLFKLDGTDDLFKLDGNAWKLLLWNLKLSIISY